ncbi:MAG: hypothetical protein WBQ61_06885 [Candidatus Acidiferrum sp.]
MLLAISIVALAQFAIYYWRAVLIGVASQPIPNEILEAVHVQETDLSGAHFEKLASLLILTPDLQHRRGSLGLVPLYFRIVGKISDHFGRKFPGLAAWGEQERFLCARFAAVQVGRRLEANLEQAASIRSC